MLDSVWNPRGPFACYRVGPALVAGLPFRNLALAVGRAGGTLCDVELRSVDLNVPFGATCHVAALRSIFVVLLSHSCAPHVCVIQFLL